MAQPPPRCSPYVEPPRASVSSYLILLFNLRETFSITTHRDLAARVSRGAHGLSPGPDLSCTPLDPAGCPLRPWLLSVWRQKSASHSRVLPAGAPSPLKVRRACMVPLNAYHPPRAHSDAFPPLLYEIHSPSKSLLLINTVHSTSGKAVTPFFLVGLWIFHNILVVV